MSIIIHFFLIKNNFWDFLINNLPSISVAAGLVIQLFLLLVYYYYYYYF